MAFAAHARAAPGGESHLIVLNVDVSTLGEELVNQLEQAIICRDVEEGLARLRGQSKRAAALGRAMQERSM